MTTLADINPDLYRHPLERQAARRLRGVPGLTALLGRVSGTLGMQTGHKALTASLTRVAPGVYGELHALWEQTEAAFGLGTMDLYVGPAGADPWQLAGGAANPVVVLDQAMLVLPHDEMHALLAGAAGAVRLGHADRLAAAGALRRFLDFSGIAGAPAAVFLWAMEEWRHYAELSCDRAAALCLGSAQPVLALLARLAGAGSGAWGGVCTPDSLRLQGIEARALLGDWSAGRWQRFSMAMDRRNTFALVRRVELEEWHAGGAPERIMSGTEAAPAEAPDAADPDPAPAFWGEFAAPGAAERPEPRDMARDFADLAGRGMEAVRRAGESFLRALEEGRA